MLKEFNEFIKKQNLCLASNTILLAVSGGIDSVVMLDLFIKSGYKCGIAHCNFNLRNKESEEDEKFVISLGEKYKIPVFVKQFHLSNKKEREGKSVQMAARDVRYSWFEKIRNQNDFSYVATAHHANDSIETFFINLIRGTGIKGLTGIEAKNNFLIRPLLFATREKIEQYCKKNKLKYREDSSNLSTKYTRNKIRHELIPLLKTINPSAEKTLLENMQRLHELGQIYESSVDSIKKTLLKKNKETWRIDIAELKKIQPLPSLLFEIVKDFGFNNAQIDSILNILDSQPGKIISSKNFRIVRDRNCLILEKIKIKKNLSFTIASSKKIVTKPFHLKLSVLKNINFLFPQDNNIACFDYNKIQFPLMLRKWESGDYFYPLGMKGKKKLSDFFIDKKVPQNIKNDQWILLSNSQIAWVIGMRIDDRFKVTDKTKKILSIEYLD